MKKRTGFVSNSSSSSFIIGVGIATDKDSIQKLKDSKNSDLTIYPLVDVINNEHSSWGERYDFKNDNYTVESFTYQSVTASDINKTFVENPGAVLVKFEDSGGGDDSDFAIYDEDDNFIEYDYDIDMDHFGQSTINTIAECEELCDSFDYEYGAGRDG